MIFVALGYPMPPGARGSGGGSLWLPFKTSGVSYVICGKRVLAASFENFSNGILPKGKLQKRVQIVATRGHRVDNDSILHERTAGEPLELR